MVISEQLFRVVISTGSDSILPLSSNLFSDLSEDVTKQIVNRSCLIRLTIGVSVFDIAKLAFQDFFSHLVSRVFQTNVLSLSELILGLTFNKKD